MEKAMVEIGVRLFGMGLMLLAIAALCGWIAYRLERMNEMLEGIKRHGGR